MADAGGSTQDKGKNSTDTTITLPYCDCMPSFETCLFSNFCFSYFVALIFYLPLMVVLYLLWWVQIPITIILNLILKLFCDCKCITNPLYNKYYEKYTLPKERLADAHHDYQPLQTKLPRAMSKDNVFFGELHRRHSHRNGLIAGTHIDGIDEHESPNVKKAENPEKQKQKQMVYSRTATVSVGVTEAVDAEDAVDTNNYSKNNANNNENNENKDNNHENNENNENNGVNGDSNGDNSDKRVAETEAERKQRLSEISLSDNKEYFRVLQFNLFAMYGRYWNRYELWTSVLNEYKPEIICFQEAIPSLLSPVGTLKTIKKMNDKKSGLFYDGFMNTCYEVIGKEFPILAKNSFIWRLILEVQTVLNTIFAISTFKKWFWKWVLRSNVVCSYCFYFFLGSPCQFGNLIALKNCLCYYKDMIPLRPGFRLAMRALYVTPKDKKIWVFNTHLTAQTEKQYEGNDVSPTVAQITEVLNWLRESEDNICRGHGVVVCGDFNSTPEMQVYELMKKNGFKSAVFEKRGVEEYTYPSGSWTYSTLVEEQRGSETLDYIWYKGNIHIENVEMFGTNTKDFKDNKKQDCTLYPSDHLGIMAQFSV